MDARFSDIFDRPENTIFRVVFFPDRIYHAQYLNATRSPRYRYNVREVRSKSDITILKGQVYMDGVHFSNFLRIEYRSSRLVEVSREKGRLLRDNVLAFIRLPQLDGGASVEETIKLNYCRWIDAFQVELWESLEPPANNHHDLQVLDMMGRDSDITCRSTFSAHLAKIDSLRRIEVAFRENDRDQPFGYFINDPAWDNNYLRNIQVPNVATPSSPANTVDTSSYLIDFQRGWFLQTENVAPVVYENPLMEEGNTDLVAGNLVEMRWLLQQELGGNLVFFHEVTIPPGKVEGTHRHIGSEELYYIVQGQGIAYMGEHDDPQLADLPVVDRDIFGLGTRRCRELQVKPGSVIYSKSGGILGIRNPGDEPLRFVAFLYHSA